MFSISIQNVKERNERDTTNKSLLFRCVSIPLFEFEKNDYHWEKEHKIHFRMCFHTHNLLSEPIGKRHLPEQETTYTHTHIRTCSTTRSLLRTNVKWRFWGTWKAVHNPWSPHSLTHSQFLTCNPVHVTCWVVVSCVLNTSIRSKLMFTFSSISSSSSSPSPSPFNLSRSRLRPFFSLFHSSCNSTFLSLSF